MALRRHWVSGAPKNPADAYIAPLFSTHHPSASLPFSYHAQPDDLRLLLCGRPSCHLRCPLVREPGE